MQVGNSSDKHQKKNRKHTWNQKLEEYWANSEKLKYLPVVKKDHVCLGQGMGIQWILFISAGGNYNLPKAQLSITGRLLVL